MRKILGKYGYRLVVIGCLIFLLSLFCVPSSAQSNDANLASQYAPVFYFEAGETCYPVDVSYHLDNSYLYQYNLEGSGIPANEVNFSLYSGTSGDGYTYLDNQRGTINDTGIISDYQQSGLDYTIYARVVDAEGKTVIQYWIFYAFNKGEFNQHEGDWEMVQIVFTAGNPKNVMCSQHYGGQIAEWDQVEKDGDHVKVYVARGSHANYLRSYSGKLTSDFVSDNGLKLEPFDYSIVMLESQNWLEFNGRWGELNSALDTQVGRAGPFGPKYRPEGEGEMWNTPVSWGNTLTPANEQIFLLEWFLYNFVMIFILLTLLSIGLLSFFIYRRHRKYGLGPRIVSMLYIDGLNLKSIGNIICIIGIIITIFALFQPWYGVTYQISGDAVFESFSTEGIVDLIKIDGIMGLQMILPPFLGSLPVTSFNLPFSLFIAIGLIFLIIATIGIHKSGKLGRKYIYRGIKIFLPILIILIALMGMGMLISGMIPETSSSSVGNSITGLLNEISSKPMGGEGTIFISEGGVSGVISIHWGLGDGGTYLLVGGIIVIAAGIIEIFARTTFFEPKTPIEKPKKQKKKKKDEKTSNDDFRKTEENKGMKIDVTKEENDNDEDEIG